MKKMICNNLSVVTMLHVLCRIYINILICDRNVCGLEVFDDGQNKETGHLPVLLVFLKCGDDGAILPL